MHHEQYLNSGSSNTSVIDTLEVDCTALHLSHVSTTYTETAIDNQMNDLATTMELFTISGGCHQRSFRL